tara:strand:+ start:1324 stop:1974 length:651 start_codon:yes stop_codon:yes gene_type:complete
MISKNFLKRAQTSLFLILLSFLMIKYDFVSIYVVIIFGVLSFLEFLEISKKIFKQKKYIYISNIFFMFYLFTFCILFYIFLNFIHLKIILYILIFGCVASDIGGFIFGKIFGGKKLTKISPNKTYSGAIGSIFLTCITISSLTFLFTNEFSIFILLLSIITSLGCQLGDLFFSYLKRKAKIKDTGKILPGHGGVLDRVDGILFGVPLGFFLLILIS